MFAAAVFAIVASHSPHLQAADTESEVTDDAADAPDDGEDAATEGDAPDRPAINGEIPTGGGWAVTAAGFTELPLQLGAELTVDAPGPLRLRGGLGYLPNGYMQVANQMLVGAFDNYTEADAALVESTIGNSLLWQLGGGFVTGDNQGFFLLAGYTAATFAGTAASGDLIERSTEREIPQRIKNRYADREFQISSTLHQVDLEIGVEWKFDHLSLRSGIGWSWTFAANTTVDAQFGQDDDRTRQTLDEIESDVETHLDDTYRRHIHPPYLSAGVGVSFY